MEFSLNTKVGQKIYEINLNVRSPESQHSLLLSFFGGFNFK